MKEFMEDLNELLREHDVKMIQGETGEYSFIDESWKNGKQIGTGFRLCNISQERGKIYSITLEGGKLISPSTVKSGDLFSVILEEHKS